MLRFPLLPVLALTLGTAATVLGLGLFIVLLSRRGRRV